MSNNYVINALWKAAGDAVSHQDMEALKDIVKAIDTYGNPTKSESSKVLKIVEKKDRPLNYLVIVSELDKVDAFNRFFEYTKNTFFSPQEFCQWLSIQPDTEWLTKTKNFSKQLTHILYRAANKSEQFERHIFLKDVTKGAKGKTYYYNPMSSQFIAPLFA